MALLRSLMVIAAISLTFQWTQPLFTAGLSGHDLVVVRSVGLIIWAVLVLVGIVRSTRDVYWCWLCKCERCRKIVLNRDSCWFAW